MAIVFGIIIALFAAHDIRETRRDIAAGSRTRAVGVLMVMAHLAAAAWIFQAVIQGKGGWEAFAVFFTVALSVNFVLSFIDYGCRTGWGTEDPAV
jgi:hypothetical protein